MKNKNVNGNIDWNIWHNKVKDAIAAFNIDDVMIIAGKLNLEFGEDDPISYGSILEVLNDMMEWMIVHYESNWDGNIETVDKIKHLELNYYRDEGNFIVTEQHFRTKECCDLFDTFIRVTLCPTSYTDPELYFKIEFICVGQMW